MTQLAAANEQTVIQALKSVADRLVAVDKHIRAILGGGPELEAWESFIAGYAEFHLHTPRYRLKELLPEYYP